MDVCGVDEAASLHITSWMPITVNKYELPSS